MGFDAGTLASGSLLMQGVGGVTSAFGAYSAAKGQKSALEAQAGLADTNARIAELSAQTALSAGQQQVGAHTLRVGQLKGRQRATMAANGVDLTSSSAVETMASTDIMKEIDTNTIVANSVRSAWGYRMQGVNSTNEALMKRAAGSNISPSSAAFSSLLGSAGGVAKSWYMLDKMGALTPSDVSKANMAPDPIASLGESRSWWGS